jgi:hypothetical protein
MARKLVRCACSGSRLRKGQEPSGHGRKDTRFDFSKCECSVNGKRITKFGRDDIEVEVVLTTRKGYAVTL